MKYTARILLLLIAVLIVVILVNRTGTNPEPSNENTLESNEVAEVNTFERCYAQKDTQVIDEDTTLYGYSFLTANIAGNQVEGNYENYPAEKDAMYGIFSGEVIMDDTDQAYLLSTLYSYSAEGMENTEEKFFILNDDQALVGYGEMEETSDGTYVYSDPTMVNFSFAIPQINCDDYETMYSEFSEMRN